jgi:hypothetical protein
MGYRYIGTEEFLMVNRGRLKVLDYNDYVEAEDIEYMLEHHSDLIEEVVGGSTAGDFIDPGISSGVDGHQVDSFISGNILTYRSPGGTSTPKILWAYDTLALKITTLGNTEVDSSSLLIDAPWELSGGWHVTEDGHIAGSADGDPTPLIRPVVDGLQYDHFYLFTVVGRLTDGAVAFRLGTEDNYDEFVLTQSLAEDRGSFEAVFRHLGVPNGNSLYIIPSNIAAGEIESISLYEIPFYNNSVELWSPNTRTIRQLGNITDHRALDIRTDDVGSVFLGYNAGRCLGNVSRPAIAIGYRAMARCVYYNIGIGAECLRFTQGEENIAIGEYALRNSVSNTNTCLGHYGMNESFSDMCVSIGEHTLENSRCNGYIAVGVRASVNTRGMNSVVLGFEAGQNMQTSHSVIIGSHAGNRLNIDNQLVIETQEDQDIPLIQGDFLERTIDLDGLLSTNSEGIKIRGEVTGSNVQLFTTSTGTSPNQSVQLKAKFSDDYEYVICEHTL